MTTATVIPTFSKTQTEKKYVTLARDNSAYLLATVTPHDIEWSVLVYIPEEIRESIEPFSYEDVAKKYGAIPAFSVTEVYEMHGYSL